MTRFNWLTARPVAHRGYHDRAKGRIENTVSSVAAAVAHRFAIEVDLQLTEDDEVIGFHDDTLDRLCEASGRVDQLTLAALRATRLRDCNERIPTLDEILEEVAGRATLFLELKSRWTGDRHLEQAVARTLANYAGPVAVMSFDPLAVGALRRLAPHLPRGLVAGRFVSTEEHPLPPHYRFALRHLLAAGFALPSFIAYQVKALPASAPLMIRHAFGLPLLTWTVRTEAERMVARRWADQMIFEGFDPNQKRGGA
jgi:glycerophosphoryl diester phosphodiesterase